MPTLSTYLQQACPVVPPVRPGSYDAQAGIMAMSHATAHRASVPRPAAALRAAYFMWPFWSLYDDLAQPGGVPLHTFVRCWAAILRALDREPSCANALTSGATPSAVATLVGWVACMFVRGPEPAAVVVDPRATKGGHAEAAEAEAEGRSPRAGEGKCPLAVGAVSSSSGLPPASGSPALTARPPAEPWGLTAAQPRSCLPPLCLTPRAAAAAEARRAFKAAARRHLREDVAQHEVDSPQTTNIQLDK